MKIYWKVFLLLNIVACSPKWKYYQKNNSDNWAKINENYKFCKIGSNQSPIDVIADFAPSDLTFNFQKNKQNNVEKEYVPPSQHKVKTENFMNLAWF